MEAIFGQKLKKKHPKIDQILTELARINLGLPHDPPREELLAALPLLESLEFLEQEFGSFEREVALVVDPRDAVFLELLELGG